MNIRELCSGLRLPEGPVALADGSIVVTEVAGGCMTRVYPDGSRRVIAQTGGGPNGAAIGPDGKCYICNNGGIGFAVEDGVMKLIPNASESSTGYIQRLDLDSGKFDTIYTRAPTIGLLAPNDLVFDAHGGFWFTDSGKGRPRTYERGGVFYAKADGSFIEEVITPLDHPNGIGLSPNGKTLYVAETYTGHVLRFDVVAPGKLDPAERRFLGRGTVVGRALPGSCLDSLAIDTDGFVCVATPVSGGLLEFGSDGSVVGRVDAGNRFGTDGESPVSVMTPVGGGLLVLAPDGSSVEHIALPDLITTNICFGGPDLRTAYMTFSHTGKLVSFDWPRPGLKLNYNA